MALEKRIDPPLTQNLQPLQASDENSESIRTARSHWARNMDNDPDRAEIVSGEPGLALTTGSHSATYIELAASLSSTESQLTTEHKDWLFSEKLREVTDDRSRSALLKRLPYRNRNSSASRSNGRQPIQEVPETSPEMNVLLQGIPESGKSTLMKSMELFHGRISTEEERRSFCAIIFDDVTRSVL